VIDLAALLSYGPFAGGWVAAFSEFTYLMFRRPRGAWRWKQRGETALFNAGLKVLMALTGGTVYGTLGGSYPPLHVTTSLALPLAALFLTWFGLDHLGWAIRVALESGREGLAYFLRRVLVPSLLVELAPLPVSLLIVAVYIALDPPVFLLLMAALVVVSLMVQRLVEAQRRLQTRVAELTLLTELGREIQKAQMDTVALCGLAYQYVNRVVDASNLILDLLDRDNAVVRRAVWIENGERREPIKLPVTDAMTWLQANPTPLLIRGLDRELTPFPIPERHMRSGLYVPLLATGDLIGLLTVQSPQPYVFTEDDARVVAAIVNPLAVAIENAWLYDRAMQRAVQLRTISEVSRQVAAILNLEELFRQVVELVQHNFGYDHVRIFTQDADGDEVVFRSGTSPMSEVWRRERYSLRVGEGIIGWVAANRQPLLVNDVTQEPRYRLDKQGSLHKTRAELAVPLMVEDRILGVLDVQSNVPGTFTGDDLFVLQTLADQVAVAIEDARLYQQALEQERLQRELDVAREIQASLLPETPPEIRGWDIAVRWQPARNVAGDFYDFIPLPDGRWGILIADVSGKGVPAALFMTLARTLIRTMAIDKGSPARALEHASDLIVTDARADMFVTVFYAVLDSATGAVTYANAGHLPPLIYCCQACGIACLLKGGIALGAVPDIELKEHAIELAPGDLLIMFTDGITEAVNARVEQFGDERLARLVAEHYEASAGEMVEIIAAALADFVGGQPTFDDQAVVVVKRASSVSFVTAAH
jgi:sigma-B regulation protein RsbU (phosphoserine phosphatase)